MGNTVIVRGTKSSGEIDYREISRYELTSYKKIYRHVKIYNKTETI